MSAWEGSLYQEQQENARRAREAAPTCRGSIALGSGCKRCTRCHEEQLAISNAVAAKPSRAVGTRRVSVELSEDDIRRMAGASPGATVEVLSDPGPTGVPIIRVLVTWKEAP